jgi:hypothetical protein
MNKIIKQLSEWADIWFCIYCGAGFGSQVELASHLNGCGYDKR